MLRLVTRVDDRGVLLVVVLHARVLVVLVFSNFVNRVVFAVAFASAGGVLCADFGTICQVCQVNVIRLDHVLLYTNVVFGVLILRGVEGVRHVLVVHVHFAIVKKVTGAVERDGGFPFLFGQVLVVRITSRFTGTQFVVPREAMAMGQVANVVHRLNVSGPLVHGVTDRRVREGAGRVRDIGLVASFRATGLGVTVTLTSSVQLRGFVFLEHRVLAV